MTVVEAGPKASLESVVCFGGEDWWYHNHGHIDMQIMRRFARAAPVLYVNSIVMRKWNVGEGRVFLTRLIRKTGSILRGARQVEPGFSVYSPASLPVHHVPGAREANSGLVSGQVRLMAALKRMTRPLVWVACPAACDTALSMRRSALVYQRTDRFEEYPGVDADQVRAYDRRLKEAADVTVYVSHKMLRQEAWQCRRAVFLDHGVDYERFAGPGREGFVPPDIAHVSGPVAGFYGDMDAHLVDVELLERVVALLPEFRFIFIGTSTVDTSALAGAPNVTMLPRRPYDVIPFYGRRFDVALMPWRRNRWIDGCNPVKLKEYLALGKPVVSTPFAELEYYSGLVETATEAGEFARKIRKAHMEDSPRKADARRARVRDCTWDSRAALALESVGLEGAL